MSDGSSSSSLPRGEEPEQGPGDSNRSFVLVLVPALVVFPALGFAFWACRKRAKGACGGKDEEGGGGGVWGCCGKMVSVGKDFFKITTA